MDSLSTGCLKREIADLKARLAEMVCPKCGYDYSQGIVACEACTFEASLKDAKKRIANLEYALELYAPDYKLQEGGKT